MPEGESKRITEFGVFLWTAAVSLFAYIWMLIVYEFWTPDEVTAVEAWLTLAYLPILVGAAYLLDARPWSRATRQKLLAARPDGDDDGSGGGDGGDDARHPYQVRPARSGQWGAPRGDMVVVPALRAREIMMPLDRSGRLRGDPRTQGRRGCTRCCCYCHVPAHRPRTFLSPVVLSLQQAPYRNELWLYELWLNELWLSELWLNEPWSSEA